MHAVKEDKGLCMQCRRRKEHARTVEKEDKACMEGRERKKHACIEERESRMHAVKEEKVSCM